jgi:predicted nucleic acid-binding protein
MFRGKLTSKINQEWILNLLKNRSDLTHEQLQRTCCLLERAMPDCMVTGYETLISGLTLPDPDDRHVLAAAITCQAQVIVTCNLKDFPKSVLSQFNIEALHLDTFLRSQADLALPCFLGCIREILQRLKNPPLTPKRYITDLAAQGLVQTASFLMDYAHLF